MTNFITKTSFADQLAETQSIFKKAFDKAVKLKDQILADNSAKTEKIQTIQSEIDANNKVLSECDSFMNKLSDIINP